MDAPTRRWEGAPSSRWLPAAWAVILMLAGIIVMLAPVRFLFLFLMFAVLLAGGVAMAVAGLVGRDRRWGWQVAVGLLGILPGVAQVVDISVFYPRGSDPGLGIASVVLAVLAGTVFTVFNLLSWRRPINAVLGAVQLGLLVSAGALVILPPTCVSAAGHKGLPCAEALVTGVGACTVAGGLAVLATLIVSLAVSMRRPG